MTIGGLGSVVYDIVAQDKTAEGLDSAGDRAKKIGKVAGVAMTGIGAAMTLMTDSAKKTNATIGVTAMQLGVAKEEMRELTLATTNVTFPIEEVTATFDLLTRAGMEDKDMIAEVATELDTLGDAIGKTASEVAGPMITAMKTFGLEVSEAGDYTDKMTYLMRNTTLELDNFGSVIAKIPPDIVEMGLTMDDTIAILGLMEESGLSGAIATREFEKAVTEARESGEDIATVLGFTSEEVDNYKDKLEGATGMTQEYADVANTQYGTVDKVKQSISELTLKYGSMLEPLDALGPAMTTLGPIMIMMSTINTASVAPLMAHAAAAWAAMSPYLAVIAPIAAVIAILYILEKKFGILTKAMDWMKEAMAKLVDWLKDVFVTGLENAKMVIAFFGEKFEKVKDAIALTIDTMQEIISRIWEVVTKPIQKVIDWLTGLHSRFLEAGKNIIQGFIDGIKQLINKPAELIEGALGSIADMLPFSPAKIGPLSKIPDWESYLIEPLNAVKINQNMIFSREGGGLAPRGTGNGPNAIIVDVEATIYNYSDIEDLERKIGEATAKGIHEAYDIR